MKILEHGAGSEFFPHLPGLSMRNETCSSQQSKHIAL
jgi:hypothetical protein